MNTILYWLQQFGLQMRATYIFSALAAAILLTGLFQLSGLQPPSNVRTADPENAASQPSSQNVVSNSVNFIEQCDYLAADNHDPESRRKGRSDVELKATLAVAMSACERAVDSVSGDRAHARLFYQLGRTYELARNWRKASSQYAMAAEHGHAGAQTKLIAYELVEGESDPSVLADHYAYLSDADAQGYKPAAALIDQYGLEQLIAENAAWEFDATLFTFPELMSAAYSRDTSVFAHLKNDALFMDYFGVQRSLALYIGGWEQAISQVWVCPTLAPPGLAAAAHRHETETMVNNVINNPIDIVGGAIEIANEIFSNKSKHNPTLGSVATDIISAGSRNEEQIETVKAQGEKDAMILYEVYGCDSDVSHRIAGTFAHYFKSS